MTEQIKRFLEMSTIGATIDIEGNCATADSSTVTETAVDVTIASSVTSTAFGLLFAPTTAGEQVPLFNTTFTANPATGNLTATTFTGNVTGNVTGNSDTATDAAAHIASTGGSPHVAFLATALTLIDDASTASTLFTIAAPCNFVTVLYKIVRDDGYTSGIMNIAHNGTTAGGDITSSVSVGTAHGITFAYAVATGVITVSYTSTATGVAGTFNYAILKKS